MENVDIWKINSLSTEFDAVGSGVEATQVAVFIF